MTELVDKFRGCLLGLAVGDAVGSRYEGMSFGWIFSERLGDGKSVIDAVDEEIRYTDDTQMAIGVAQTLVECGRIDEDALCRNFLTNFEPWRGYGRGTKAILQTMEDGGDWRRRRDSLFAGGSYGNGAAMRVAPVGLLFHRDLDQVAEQARLSALPTHHHPLGVEGAQLLAIAVALCVTSSGDFARASFFEALHSHCQSDEYRQRLNLAREMETPFDLHKLGNGIEAHESVVTAITCFALSPDSYAGTIDQAIRLGGDTDTIAAMAGACAGARLGIEAIPSKLLQALENGPQGRDEIDALAQRLAAVAT